MEPTRRTVLRTLGAGAATPAVRPGGHSGGSGGHSEWTTVESPTDRTLHDVAHTDAGAVAVGAGGVVVHRQEGSWRVAVSNGPAGNGSNLRAVATTDGGDRAWLAGASGALGRYDPERNHLTARSAPGGVTDTFTDIAVAGPAGEETIRIADASGHVHVSRDAGADGTWHTTTPGSGAAITAMDCTDTRGVLVDQNGSLFETDRGTWTAVPALDLDGTPLDISLDSDDTVVIATADGTVVGGHGSQWERETPVGQTLWGVEAGNCGCVHAVGAGGTVVHRRGHGRPIITTLARWFDWWHVKRPTGQNLHALSIGPPHVAVGAAGTVLER